MTELDLLIIRQREHEIRAAELRIEAAKIKGKDLEISQYSKYLENLLQAQELFSWLLEKDGHDYLTITAEMARIRAEVRGEK